MKYLPLIWAALWRKPTRTIFTMLAVVANFLLFGLLQGVNIGFASVIAEQHLDRLLTDPRVPGGAPMPGAAQALIEKLPSVTRVAKRSMFFGYYQEQKNGFGALATDPQNWFDVRPEFKISPQQLEALLKTRDGLAVTPAILNRYGWKIGDRIPIRSPIPRQDGDAAWSFQLVATFDEEDNPGQATVALINYDYFDQARNLDRGTVDRFIVRINDPTRSTQTASAIDALFANSAHETRTQSEKEMTQSAIKQVGDISFFTNAVAGAVFFTLLFLTANTTAQSVRERIPELAMLKTVGFSDFKVLWLVLAEALFLCILAALLGLAAAAAIFPLLGKSFGLARLSWIVVLAGMVAAVLVAFASAALPAWRARRLSIVDALARR